MVHSTAFRFDDARALPGPDRLTRLIPGPKALKPVGLADQLDVFGVRALHWPIAADPNTGAWAVAGGPPALGQPGIKVVDPLRGADPDADCATLMTCVALVRRWSAATPGHAEVVVLLDARGPGAQSRLDSIRRAAAGVPGFVAPTLEAITREMRAAFAAAPRTGGPLVFVVSGAAGGRPSQTPFQIARRDSGPYVAQAVSDETINIERARAAGRMVILVDAEHAPHRIRPDDAARIADVVLLSTAAARRAF